MPSPRNNPRVVCTIAARMTSTRLPGKILMPILGRPALELLVERVKRVPGFAEIVIATTTNDTDEPVVRLAEKLGCGVFRGSEHDVLGRIAGAVRAAHGDILVELTSDNILADPAVVRRCLDAYLEGGVDYVANGLVRTYPIGLDVHVFGADLLDQVDKAATAPDDREHIGLYIYQRPKIYRLRNVAAPPELTWPDLHLTLDTAADYALLKAVYEGLYPSNPAFTLSDVLSFLRSHPEVAGLNREVKRKKIINDYFAETGHALDP